LPRASRRETDDVGRSIGQQPAADTPAERERGRDAEHRDQKRGPADLQHLADRRLDADAEEQIRTPIPARTSTIGSVRTASNHGTPSWPSSIPTSSSPRTAG
jgi:hypothetical protein